MLADLAPFRLQKASISSAEKVKVAGLEKFVCVVIPSDFCRPLNVKMWQLALIVPLEHRKCCSLPAAQIVDTQEKSISRVASM
jgi:hypothetical protein